MKFIRNRSIFITALSFGTGVITAYLFDMPSVAMLIAAILLGILTVFGRIRMKRRPAMGFAALIAFFLMAACAGCAYTGYRMEARPEFETVYSAAFSGRLTGSPYTDQDGKRFVCTLTDIEVDGTVIGFDMRLYLRSDDAEALKGLGSGQMISGTGHVFCPERSTNPHEFDFGEYLWNEGMGGYISAKLHDVSVEGEKSGIAAWFYDVRTVLGERIDRLFPRSAELVKALVLGERRDMDDDIRDDFRTAGVAHLLAISGLHITIVALFISTILKFIIGIKPASFVTVLCVFFYGALVGYSPSIIRAAIMYALLCAAPAFGRRQEGTTRLSIAFMAILIIDPLSIADPGFVLSFCASAGLMWLTEPVKRLFRLHKAFKGFRFRDKAGSYISGLMVATICAQIATYPAIAMFYGTFSIVSLISNLILVPLSLASLIAAYIGVLLPFFAPVPDIMMKAIILIAGLCAEAGWAEIPVSAPQAWLWIEMLLIGLAVSEMSRLPRRLKPWLTLLLPVGIVLSIIFTTIPGVMIVFLDVGQGDSAVVRTEDYTCVIDLGEDGSEAIAYITGENLTVDTLYLSHPDSDHAGGLGEFAAACDIEMIYIPDGFFEEMGSERLAAEWKNVTSGGVKYTVLKPGDVIPIGDTAEFEILDCGVSSGDRGNDISLIMLLDYGLNQVLFTGDARIGVSPDIDILKVSHHGSVNSTTEEFIMSATPKAAIISVGRNNRYDHPSPEVIALLEDCGADIYRTDIDGAITVHLDRDGDFETHTFMEESR